MAKPNATTEPATAQATTLTKTAATKVPTTPAKATAKATTPEAATTTPTAAEKMASTAGATTSDRVRELEAKVKAFEHENSKLAADIKSVTKEKTQLIDTVEKIKREKAKLAAQNVSLKTQVEELNEANKDLQDVVSELKMQIKRDETSYCEWHQLAEELAYRFVLCKALILDLYYFPGHLLHMTHLNKNGLSRSKIEAMRQSKIKAMRQSKGKAMPANNEFDDWVANEDEIRASLFRDIQSTLRMDENKGLVHAREPVVGEHSAQGTRWMMTGEYMLSKPAYSYIMDNYVESVAKDTKKLARAESWDFMPNFPYSNSYCA